MEKVELPIHEHPLLPITRFYLFNSTSERKCGGCNLDGFIYGGYRCDVLECSYYLRVFHKECAESLPEINHHPSHPDHPLKLHLHKEGYPQKCSRCGDSFGNGYICSICDFKLDLNCARGQGPLLLLENPDVHEHSLGFLCATKLLSHEQCGICYSDIPYSICYECPPCKLYFHKGCAKFFPEANHTSHPQHPLKLLACEAMPDYADKQCLLCGGGFYKRFHHCDVCNFSVCKKCMVNPPPVVVVSPTTHEHQLHLVPRRMDFTCNACGTQGDRSPYFCLQCNFMIHRDCIDLPRVININRHDHRVSYTRRLGHGHENWKCGVCRKTVDGFHGAYSCSKCSDYSVHSKCATREDVWDAVELEGTPEEEEIPPFEVIDDNTIKHFSHNHNLRFNKDGHTLHESILCQACIFQIGSETYYSCEQCDFIIHRKCANLPRKKRHVCHNQQFTLQTDPLPKFLPCCLCDNLLDGFRYRSGDMVLDVRCGSIGEPFEHKSHSHPLFYNSGGGTSCTCTICGEQPKHGCSCDECGEQPKHGHFSCDECDDFRLCFKCGMLPQKVMRHRYDDHPLFLSYGECNAERDYWCEACETKVNSKECFYTCNDCGITLHISCIVGDFSNIMPGSEILDGASVVPNTSICRSVCTACNSRCKLPSIFKISVDEIVAYFCSMKCLATMSE